MHTAWHWHPEIDKNGLYKIVKVFSAETDISIDSHKIPSVFVSLSGSVNTILFTHKRMIMSWSLLSFRLGSYLVILYLFTKLLYIGNVIAQLFVLNTVLATKYNIYGVEVLSDMAGDHDWMDRKSVAFPRVTMCDFRVILTIFIEMQHHFAVGAQPVSFIISN